MLTALVILLSFWTGAFVFAVITYYRFTRSTEYRWRQQVFARFVQLVTQRNEADYTLDLLDSDHESLGELKQQFAEMAFTQVAVETLTRFSGVGPMTITRLHEANLTTVAQVAGVKLTAIPNLNRAQSSALHRALETMLREAMNQPTAFANPEAQRIAAEIQRLTAGQLTQRQEAERKQSQAEAGLQALTMKLNLAERIRFANFLMGTLPAGLSRELMAEPILLPVATAAPSPPVAPVVVATPAPNAGPMNPDAMPNTKPGELPSLTRFRVAARFGYAVAKADGRTAAGEKRQIRVFLERRYATAAYLITKINQLIAEIEKNVPTLEESLAEVRATIPPDNWPELNQFAISVTDASGERNARKNAVLARVATALEVTPNASTTPLAPVPVPATPATIEPPKPPTDNDCKKVLEITLDTSLNVDLIRRQYRLLSERYEPTKFTAHGPEFVQLAKNKREAIERAALQLLKPYNEPLEPPAPPPPPDLRHNPDLDDFFGG